MAKRKQENPISEMPLQVGTVPYCNAWPLVHYLPSRLSGMLLSEWFPSEMRLRLMAHHLDLALMPVAELMNLPYGKIVGNGCIACRGPVQSVRLISKKPIEKIKTISLDTASRSSITICELLLRHFYDLRPTRYKLSADKPLDDCQTDAFVVIGDRALAFNPSARWEHCFDLGELWLEKTGLPLVFAAWIACTDRAYGSAEIIHALQEARDHGTANIPQILAERDPKTFPVSRDEVFTYLNDSIVYQLGDEEMRGLQSFFDLALLHGFAKHRTVVDVVEAG